MMRKKEEELLKEKSRKISIIEGSAFGVSEGFGFRYLTPFALAMNAGNSFIGLLSSIPLLLGNFAQLISLKQMKKFSRKKIVFWSVFFQALMWLSLVFIAVAYFSYGLSSTMSLWLLFIFYSLLVGIGSIAKPAWNSWMRDLVDGDCLGRYFSKRNAIAGFVGIVSMLIAGLILSYFKNVNLMIGFTILFGTAFLARTISSFLFLKQYEPKFEVDDKAYFSFLDFVKKIRESNFGRFVVYLFVFFIFVSIASPFFAVYLLNELQFSYIMFTIIILTPSLATLLFLPFWGYIEDTHGSVKILKITGFLIAFVPLLWAIHSLVPINIFYYLILVEIFSGFVWSGFNLAHVNFVFDAVSRQRTALCVAYVNILIGIAFFIGANIGGKMSSFGITLFGLNPLVFLFVIAFIGRLISYLFLIPGFKEVRKVKELNLDVYFVDFFKHLEHKILRPKGGTLNV